MSNERADTEAIPAVAEDPHADRGRQMTWMVIGQVLAVLCVIGWIAVMSGSSAAASDPSGGGPGAWLFTAIAWGSPLWPIGFSIAAWVYWSRGRSSWAGMLMTMAFVPALLLMLLVGLSAV